MEVHIDRDAFLKGLQIVQSLVEPRQTLPILANALLEANDASIRLTATDLEVGARVSIPARVTTTGAITLPARKLWDIVRELPPSTLSIKLQDSKVSLRSEGVAYKLAALAAEDFPPVTSETSSAGLTLNAKALRKMLAQTSFAISHDEGRYALTGLLFSLSPSEIRLVATDGHRLAVASQHVATNGQDRSGIVPRKAVQEVARVLGAAEEVAVVLSENQFTLSLPNLLLTARLIDGVFPNYEHVIPNEQPRRFQLPRPALIAALRRVSVLSEERAKPVRLHFSGGTLRVRVHHAELGEAEDILPVDGGGEELSIGFSSRYLLDALAPIEAEQVVLELKDGVSPAILKPAGEEGYLSVIMPMQI